MGCSSCGKKSAGAKAAAQRVAAPPQPGSGPTNAILLGDELADSLIRVRVMQNVPGLRAGHSAWVQGSNVAGLVASGALRDISSTTQRRRVWMVGKHSYTNQRRAERVAATLGLVAVEVA